MALGSPPNLPVQGAELDRFADVIGGDALRIGQIGDGAGDLQDVVVGECSQMPSLVVRSHRLE